MVKTRKPRALRAPRRALLLSAALPVLLAAGFAAANASGYAGDNVPVATEAPEGTGVETLRLAPSGHLRKEFGEPAGLSAPGSDSVFFEITIHDVTVAESCPGRGVDVPPEHGYFVVVELEASMVDALPDGSSGADLFMPLTADAFTLATTAARVDQPTLTDASWGCFADDELAAPFVGLGESVSGKVVLDSPVRAGTLVYAPGGSGWEWEFGQ